MGSYKAMRDREKARYAEREAQENARIALTYFETIPDGLRAKTMYEIEDIISKQFSMSSAVDDRALAYISTSLRMSRPEKVLPVLRVMNKASESTFKGEGLLCFVDAIDALVDVGKLDFDESSTLNQIFDLVKQTFPSALSGGNYSVNCSGFFSRSE